MDKVYRKYKEAASKLNPQLMEELGVDMSEGGDHLGMGVVRKENDLNNDEKQFLLTVERGDIPKTRNFLEESQIYFNININCVDPLGRTALLIAIENENIEMIELLLMYNVELGDALLHAINEENVEAVELLLSHQQSMSHKKDLSGTRQEGFLGGVPSSSFTPDITPIILAAHRDNYEIIKILLDRGDRIPKPHDVRCSCQDCEIKTSEDSLNHSRSRINAYRALSSPSLIALSSKDPILTAFELSWELKRLSRLENEFKCDYEQLAKQCQDFAVDLLDQTRGSKELEIVLNHDMDGPVYETGHKMNLARLILAIKYKQKKFVAHPNCQQLLASLWYEGLPGFRRRHVIFKAMWISSVSLFFPVLSMMYLVFPRCGIGRFTRRPFIKFLMHSSSYIMFLLLLILASQRIQSVLEFGGTTEKLKSEIRGAPPTIIEWLIIAYVAVLLILASQRLESLFNISFGGGITQTKSDMRGSPPTLIEWMIIVYVAGLVWAEIKQLWNDGARAYIQDMWNIIDFTTNSLYIATFTLRLVAYINVAKERRIGSSTADMPREEWDAYDPNLISEGLFAAANIFSSLKVIYIFTVNPHLGPLQISLGRMVTDILKWGFIYVLVIFSFGCGVNQLYWYYAEMYNRRCVGDTANSTFASYCESKKHKSIANLFEILQTMYFAVFGLVDVETFELHQVQHEFTQFVGKLMFGTYNFISIIVLLNMLIAMLSNSYQSISDDTDTEWKFARSKLWMSYFEDGGTVPPPFNIIPTPKSIFNILRWLKDKMCKCSQRQKRSKWQSIRKLVKKVNERDAKYQAVMRDLVKRYIMCRSKGQQDQGVTEDDLNEIKQDISSFRYELLEILRNNGMKLPNVNPTQKRTSHGKLRRRKSQMSFQRLERQIKISDTIPEAETFEMPKFLAKQDSSISTDSKSLEASLNGSQTNTAKIRENGNIATSKRDLEAPVGAPPSDQNPPPEVVKKDEGLGESFEQQSDSESNSKLRNGNGGSRLMYGSVPEEQEMVKSTNEITLDPAKLPGYNEAVLMAPDLPSVEPGSIANENLDSADPGKGENKKVSFIWGQKNLENGDDVKFESKGE